MPDRFLCQDADCWITPEEVAAHRRRRRPDLAVDATVLYTPLDFGVGGANWLVDALAPIESRPIGDVSIQAHATAIRLPDGELTALLGPIGAPATVASLEAAIGLGARRVLFFGICGSLQPDLRIGDLILVADALREEGTSYHYLPADVPAVASPSLLAAARAALDAANAPYHEGTIWTTDAPYRETRTKVARLAAEGVLGVEMEVSAVYALAQYRGIEALALQIVSDQLVGEKWTGIDRETFRARCDEAIRLLAGIAVRTAPAPAS